MGTYPKYNYIVKIDRLVFSEIELKRKHLKKEEDEDENVDEEEQEKKSEKNV